jgi:hypothetical protein
MAGGQRLDDHSSWVGSSTEKNVFPEGVKSKAYMSAEGAGEKLPYEDTTEAIKSQQMAGNAKIRANGMKPGYRH